jgi:transposase
MPWTEITRPQYRRDDLRYASNLRDEEWELLLPFMPAERPLGRPRSTGLRSIVDAVFYIASTGCGQAWWAPADSNPRRPGIPI